MLKEIGRESFNDALEMCDAIANLSKTVGDPIAYIDSLGESDFDTVILFKEELSDKSVVYQFRLVTA